MPSPALQYDTPITARQLEILQHALGVEAQLREVSATIGPMALTLKARADQRTRAIVRVLRGCEVSE